MGEAVDGEYQSFKAKDGAYVRKEFFGKYPELLKLVEHMTDEQVFASAAGRPRSAKGLQRLQVAVEHKGSPTVILAKTIKGYGLGEAGEGRNVTHQQKKLNEDEMVYFRKRFDIPIPEETVHTISFYRPPEDSPELRYAKERSKPWAEVCRHAWFPRSKSKRRPWNYSPNRSADRRGGRSQPPWPSSACSRCC